MRVGQQDRLDALQGRNANPDTQELFIEPGTVGKILDIQCRAGFALVHPWADRISARRQKEVHPPTSFLGFPAPSRNSIRAQ